MSIQSSDCNQKGLAWVLKLYLCIRGCFRLLALLACLKSTASVQGLKIKTSHFWPPGAPFQQRFRIFGMYKKKKKFKDITKQIVLRVSICCEFCYKMFPNTSFRPAATRKTILYPTRNPNSTLIWHQQLNKRSQDKFLIPAFQNLHVFCLAWLLSTMCHHYS